MRYNIIIGILIIIALASLYYAYTQKAYADEQRGLAVIAAEEAVQQRAIAEQQRMLAQENEMRAIEQQRLAEEQMQKALEAAENCK